MIDKFGFVQGYVISPLVWYEIYELGNEMVDISFFGIGVKSYVQEGFDWLGFFINPNDHGINCWRWLLKKHENQIKLW